MALIEVVDAALHTPSGRAILVAALIILLANVSLSKKRKLASSLPPGPPSEPIIGHIRIIPVENQAGAFRRWSKQYNSDVISFNALGQPIIVLNSVRSAIDLLDNRGANYSDRPRFPLYEIMGWSHTLTFLRWGTPMFRLHRRVLQQGFSNSNVAKYRPLQEREASAMLGRLLAQPDKWEAVVRLFAVVVSLEASHGVHIDSTDHPLMKVASDLCDAVSHGGAAGGTLVDFFPFIRWLPSWLQDESVRYGKRWNFAIKNLREKPYEVFRASKDPQESLMRRLMNQRQAQLDEGRDPELSLEDIKGAAATAYSAGEDTTAGTMIIFVYCMLMNPEIQKKAQRELDEVVGRDRLPAFEDRENLPYVERVVQETFRWYPANPLGVPHRSTSDDTYNGYFIPGGSVVFSNIYAITHDEQIYSHPDDFDPDRYKPVAKGGRGEPFAVGVFGFGRRICVGKTMADASLWIAIACMLSTMRVETAKDDEGRDIVMPEVKFTYGLTSHPKDLVCRIVPRDEKSLGVIPRV